MSLPGSLLVLAALLAVTAGLRGCSNLQVDSGEEIVVRSAGTVSSQSGTLASPLT